jgi:hypothetical protein
MAQEIVKWEGGAADVPYTWRSKIHVLPSKKTLTAAKVIADAYPVYFEYFADGRLWATRTVQNRNAFRLPSGFECEEVEVRVTGTARINAVYVAETMDELRLT